MGTYLQIFVSFMVLISFKPSSASSLNRFEREPYLQNYTHEGAIHLLFTVKYPTQVRVYYGNHKTSLSLHSSDLMVREDHDLVLKHLKPDIEYFYKIEAFDRKRGWLPLHEGLKSFVTPNHLPFNHEFSAWILGDPGTYKASNFQKLFKNTEKNILNSLESFDKDLPDMVFTLGNNAYHNGSKEDFDRAFFGVFGDLMQKIPFYPLFGKHDFGNIEEKQVYSVSCPEPKGVFFDLFHLPEEGDAGGIASKTEAYYSVDYRSVHFVVLDTMGLQCNLEEMMNWLDKDLATVPDEKWTIILSHHPITERFFKNPKKLDHIFQDVENRYKSRLMKIIDKYKVDFMISGHYHRYQRTFPLIQGDIRSSFNIRVSEANAARYERGEGTIFMVAGTSGSAWENQKLDKARLTSFVSYKPGGIVIKASPQIFKLFYIGEGPQILDQIKIINTYKQI